jgi:hypothetical protein
MSVTLLPTPKRRETTPAAESIAETMRRLRSEAQAHAREHSEILQTAVVELEAIAQDIAGGGEAYLAGVRETARRLATELGNGRLQLESLLGRKQS